MRDSKAVGSRWTKAVAISTPVPKCRERKRKWWGTGNRGKRLTTIGKEHAGRDELCVGNEVHAGTLTRRTQREYQKKCEYVCWRVVVTSAALGPARRSLIVLPSEQLCTQQACRHVGPREAWHSRLISHCASGEAMARLKAQSSPAIGPLSPSVIVWARVLAVEATGRCGR